MVIISICVILLLLYIAFFTDPLVQCKAHWQHFFDQQSISTEIFFTRVKEDLVKRKIGVGITQPTMPTTHIFSSQLVYLRIAKSDLVFYLCVAPFGTGTFVSWWQCETVEGIINRIPILSRLTGKDRKNKTFYQIDTEGMYKSIIHSTVLSAIDEIANANGYRLSELDRQYKDLRS